MCHNDNTIVLTPEEIRSQARETCNFLVEQRNEFINDQFSIARELIDAGDYREFALKLPSYNDEDRINYSDPVTEAIYHCRYSTAYSFEYAVLWHIILSSYKNNPLNNQDFTVMSLGCGAMTEAWSLAYSKALLTSANEEYNDIQLSFEGYDLIDWHKHFIPRDREHADSDEKRKLLNLFHSIRLHTGEQDGDATGSFANNITKAPKVIILPKLFNHIKENPRLVENLKENLANLSFEEEEEYYIVISHAQSDVCHRRINEAGNTEVTLNTKINAGKDSSALFPIYDMIQKIADDNSMTVCDDIWELVDQNSRDYLANNWLYHERRTSDHLINITDCNSIYLPDITKESIQEARHGMNKCYVFRSAFQNFRSFPNSIKYLNDSFALNENIVNLFKDIQNNIKEEYDTMNNELLEEGENPIYPRSAHTNCILNVDKFAFQIFKLTRNVRNDDDDIAF